MSTAPQKPHRRWSGLVTRLRRLNIEAVLGALIDDGPSTAAEIARVSSLSVVSVNRILQELAADEVITELRGRYGRPGPPARVFALQLDHVTAAAVVYQPDSLTVVRAGLRTFEAPVTVPQAGRPEPARMVEALHEAAVLPGDLTCLVVGTVWGGDETPAAQALSMENELSGRLGCPVTVQSTVTLAAVAEARLGVARGVEDFLLVSGDGTALVVGGEARPGAHGAAGSLLTFGRRVLNRAGRKAALSAVAATCLVTDPELVVLGEAWAEDRLPVDKVREALADLMATSPPRVVESRLGRPAPVLGAVEMTQELAHTALLAAASRVRA